MSDVIEETSQRDNDKAVFMSIGHTLGMLRTYRPQERSERSRYYAICITDIEKVEALFNEYVMKE